MDVYQFWLLLILENPSNKAFYLAVSFGIASMLLLRLVVKLAIQQKSIKDQAKRTERQGQQSRSGSHRVDKRPEELRAQAMLIYEVKWQCYIFQVMATMNPRPLTASPETQKSDNARQLWAFIASSTNNAKDAARVHDDRAIKLARAASFGTRPPCFCS